ncbi:MAG TPA: ABC transporter substrate-binding protein, partial [Gammaproteobacteria bacterium]|nr:ABC transporter substrate-binding protein [Gammaproteobacteria bacterium]
MRAIHTRREFLIATAAFGAAKTLATRSAFADEAPPETTTIRLAKSSTICLAPFYVAEELLRMEGFADIQYVDAPGGFAFPQLVASGRIDFASTFAGSVVYHLDRGLPITVFGGLHVGCYELFAHGPIHKVSDLKGRRVGIQTQASSGHLYVSIMAAHVGLDPNKDIDWVTGANSKELFAEGKIDAFLAFPPEPQELRARNIGHTIIKTTVDRPWSQYFCCMPFANRDFVKTYPIATKRVLRALVKAADFCAADPAGAAQRLRVPARVQMELLTAFLMIAALLIILGAV